MHASEARCLNIDNRGPWSVQMPHEALLMAYANAKLLALLRRNDSDPSAADADIDLRCHQSHLLELTHRGTSQS